MIGSGRKEIFVLKTFEELAVKLEEHGKNAVQFRVKTELLEESAARCREAKTAKAYKKEQRTLKEIRVWLDGFLTGLMIDNWITQDELIRLYRIMLDMQFL